MWNENNQKTIGAGPVCKANTSRKHLRTKVTPDFHLTYSKNGGKSGVGIKMIKGVNFRYFSIKSYALAIGTASSNQDRTRMCIRRRIMYEIAAFC